MNGQYSFDNISFFKKLVAEANCDLGLLKLPEIFLPEVPYINDVKIQEFQRKMLKVLEYLKQRERGLTLEIEQ